jgi:hypothetical protein
VDWEGEAGRGARASGREEGGGLVVWKVRVVLGWRAGLENCGRVRGQVACRRVGRRKTRMQVADAYVTEFAGVMRDWN